jgi:AraC family transcriptional regulator of adaptative response/methylated-DNA-[protein]-cysteine methyltransferase
MAATDTGICWLSFGDSPDELLEELAAAYPHTEFYNDESRLYEWFNQVRDELLLPHQALKLPMDIQGTAFQIKVWKALKHVPLGQSLSYQQLAAQMGEPQKTRAVARALGSNKIGFLIPCHRIIGQDGSLKGYRWDVKRKAVLLTREQVEHK